MYAKAHGGLNRYICDLIPAINMYAKGHGGLNRIYVI